MPSKSVGCSSSVSEKGRAVCSGKKRPAKCAASSVCREDRSGVEPLESNITALLDPENIKWKDLLSPGIETPTPWGQEEIESLRRQKAEAAGPWNE